MFIITYVVLKLCEQQMKEHGGKYAFFCVTYPLMLLFMNFLIKFDLIYMYFSCLSPHYPLKFSTV